MKLTLCTLAICLSILASVFTTKELIRTEGKKIRSSLPKSMAEADGRPDPLLLKLEAINAQLGTISRRLSSLDERSAHQGASLAPRASALPSPATSGLADTLARLDALPDQLTEITTYLDQSFEHLEKTVEETAAAKRVDTTLADLTKRMEALDSYFLPLFLFLGLDGDPANNDLLATYPSLDVRINELYLQLSDLKRDVVFIRERVTPFVYEPTKRPRD